LYIQLPKRRIYKLQANSKNDAQRDVSIVYHAVALDCEYSIWRETEM